MIDVEEFFADPVFSEASISPDGTRIAYLAPNLVDSLRARGVPVEYLVADDEGHGFQNPENLTTMFRAIEQHFTEHLGGAPARRAPAL